MITINTEDLSAICDLQSAAFRTLADSKDSHLAYGALLQVVLHSSELYRCFTSLQEAREVEADTTRMKEAAGKFMRHLLTFCVASGIHLPEILNDPLLYGDFARDEAHAQHRLGAFTITHMVSRLCLSYYYCARIEEVRPLIYAVFASLHHLVTTHANATAIECLLSLP